MTWFWNYILILILIEIFFTDKVGKKDWTQGFTVCNCAGGTLITMMVDNRGFINYSNHLLIKFTSGL